MEAERAVVLEGVREQLEEIKYDSGKGDKDTESYIERARKLYLRLSVEDRSDAEEKRIVRRLISNLPGPETETGKMIL